MVTENCTRLHQMTDYIGAMKAAYEAHLNIDEKLVDDFHQSAMHGTDSPGGEVIRAPPCVFS